MVRALGVLLMLPGGALLVALLVMLVPEMIPRTLSWDLSRDRRTSRLAATPVGDNYYFQGNLPTAVTLPGGRRWSGRARHVIVQRRGDEIEQIAWQGCRSRGHSPGPVGTITGGTVT
jgi:hypothetical protein